MRNSIKAVCAWCKRVMRKGKLLSGEATHTICAPCERKELAKVGIMKNPQDEVVDIREYKGGLVQWKIVKKSPKRFAVIQVDKSKLGQKYYEILGFYSTQKHAERFLDSYIREVLKGTRNPKKVITHRKAHQYLKKLVRHEKSDIRRYGNPQHRYNVYLRGKLIDTVFYSRRERAEDVRRSLIEHDGYDPAIRVTYRKWVPPEVARALRKRMGVKDNPRSGPPDMDAAEELALFIENDEPLYRQQYMPIVRNLMIKMARGIYDKEKAVKLWMHLMDNGARKYIREVGVPGSPVDAVFNRNTRLAAARMFEQDEREKILGGEYSREMLPKKYRDKELRANPGRRWHLRKAGEAASERLRSGDTRSKIWLSGVGYAHRSSAAKAKKLRMKNRRSAFRSRRRLMNRFRNR